VNIPVELAVWGLVSLTGLGSVVVHLLLRISGEVTAIRTEHKISQVETKGRLDQLDRHNRRNELETAQIRRHLNLSHLPEGGQRA
jgi:hypothetical protein